MRATFIVHCCLKLMWKNKKDFPITSPRLYKIQTNIFVFLVLMKYSNKCIYLLGSKAVKRLAKQ